MIYLAFTDPERSIMDEFTAMLRNILICENKVLSYIVPMHLMVMNFGSVVAHTNN